MLWSKEQEKWVRLQRQQSIVYQYDEKKTKKMNEGWSDKYKKSIDCSNPKGFSQRAHCQVEKKVNEETRYDGMTLRKRDLLNQMLA